LKHFHAQSTKWHIIPNIQNDNKFPNIKKTTIWWLIYEITVIGHSLTISTLSTLKSILEIGIYSLAQESTSSGFTPGHGSLLQRLHKEKTLLIKRLTK